MGSWTIAGNLLSIKGAQGLLGTQDNNALAIETNNTTRLFVDTNGNIGVGTNTPGQKLSVSGQESAVNGLGAAIGISNVAPGGRNWYLRAGATGTATPAGGLSIADDAAYRLVVDSSGNVGIGTISPQKPLDVAASGGIRISQTAQASDTNEIYFADNGQIRSLDDNHRIVFNRAANEFEIREFGAITFSPGATAGQRTAAVSILPSGDMTVTGDVILTGADCAEEFDVSGTQPPDPGTVVVIDEGGALRESRDAYDKKVAGVVSGAGEYRHGLVLDRRSSPEGRIPVALVGKVYCKVDARYSPIGVGDLLTTSDTPGHAMKAAEPAKAFGAVIGKALAGIGGGQGLIPIMVALQ